MAAPIKETCPTIDKCVKPLTHLINTINKLKSYELEDAGYMEDLLSDVKSEIENAVDTLEEMRTSNDTLRSWGISMEEEAESLQVTVMSLEDRISLLEEEINSIKEQAA